MRFDNVADRASVVPFVPPAGPGRVLITTQNQHWPPGQALDVPVLETEVAAGFLVNRTGDTDREAARMLVEQTAASMGRSLETDGLRELLQDNPEHPRWADVAERCLSCGNCTMVCPTCFCSSVEETTDLTGETP